MRWKGRAQSGNVEDRRALGRGKAAAGGGVGILVVAALVYLLGGDPSQVIDTLQTAGGGYGPADSSVILAEQELAAFAAVVLKDTEDIWHALFRENGMVYREPTLVLFSGAAQSACGFSSSATGPFYCPGDEKVYIDLSFLAELQRRLGAGGDFAMAYIIAHEVGHHVQKQLGILDKVHALRGRVSETEYNRYQVSLELQADFFAGIWAHHADRTKGILEEGDVDEAVNAAAAVGDDRIQMQSQGYVV
ncbi:MAG: neutral zinc metallopeptidase, partial [Candidatus Krumholzibacteria bacterium]|nr:neutral zinc metallopeptidase [Candidatus Krumholzibacteria bacterium]